MKKETLHVPQRLEGETRDEYQYRRKLSRAHNRLVLKGTLTSAGASHGARQRRAAVKLIGIRQFKKQLKAYRRHLKASRSSSSTPVGDVQFTAGAAT